MTTWTVLAPTNYRAIAWQSGVPESVVRQGTHSHLPVGTVEAATKGEAIMRAHQAFPRIPVADLLVKPGARPEEGR